jgi:hypothetical protein
MKPAYFKTCRCGQRIVILNTKRGKRLAVNVEPKGHEAYRYRGVARVEQMYEWGQHQPHLLTCTKPYDKATQNRKKFV